MKKVAFVILALAALMAVSGCEDDDNCVISVRPEPPQGVYTVTGNGAVYVFWTAPYASNIEQFVIKRSLNALTGYQEIGRVDAELNPDRDLIYYDPGFVDNTAQNGVTYWYAVASVNSANLESELSAEDVFDTPRPEGSVVLFDYLVEPSLAGFNLASQSAVGFDSPAADLYIDRDGSVFFVNAVGAGTVVQDAGYHDYFDEIGWAPQYGWTETEWSELIEGHIYVIRTGTSSSSYHYAKLWVVTVNSNSVTFQWAYQTDIDNPELAPGADNIEPPVTGSDKVAANAASNSSL